MYNINRETDKKIEVQKEDNKIKKIVIPDVGARPCLAPTWEIPSIG